MKTKFFPRAVRFLFAVLLFPCLAWQALPAEKEPGMEPWLKARLESFQDLKFGFMMHFGAYSQWGCIESWPLVEEDKWARPDDLKAWTERGKDIERFKHDYWLLPKTFNPVNFDPRAWARRREERRHEIRRFHHQAPRRLLPV